MQMYDCAYSAARYWCQVISAIACIRFCSYFLAELHGLSTRHCNRVQRNCAQLEAELGEIDS